MVLVVQRLVVEVLMMLAMLVLVMLLAVLFTSGKKDRETRVTGNLPMSGACHGQFAHDMLYQNLEERTESPNQPTPSNFYGL